MSRDLIERRSLGDVTIDGTTIVGYPIVFNVESQDLGGFVEIVKQEAVDRTLREGLDVRALLDHREQVLEVLGRSKAGTLRLTKDARGLRAEIDPPDTVAGRDAVTLLQRGDVSGMSFSFSVVRPHGERFEQRGAQRVRTLTDLRIVDVSLVTDPAYLQADAAIVQRALSQAVQTGSRIDWLRLQSQV